MPRYSLLCALSLLALGACLLATYLADPHPFYLGRRFERLDRFRVAAAQETTTAAVTARATAVMQEDTILFKSEGLNLTFAQLASLGAAAASAVNLFLLWRAQATTTTKPPP